MIRRIFLTAIALLALLVPFASFAGNTLQNFRMSATHARTRIVFDLAHANHYKTFSLHHPERLVVDFPATRSPLSLTHVPLKNSVVKSVRRSDKKMPNLRVVFDLKQTMHMKSFALKANHRQGDRVVVDLYPVVKKSASHSTQLKTAATTSSKLRDVVVVIDPGHGGKDPGASGAHGTKEKNVVLAIAKHLQSEINSQPGMHAVLTRSSDYFISLRGRLRIARKKKGDIFVAVHADAFKRRSSHGASVYALSQRGASSEAARWLAEKENYSELGDVQLEDKSYLLRSVLLDLSQTATINDSLKLGSEVISELGRVTSLHNHKVEQARFVVLKSPDIPSILVETGFISNPIEEHRLSSPVYQRSLSRAIAKGIREYFFQSPPHDTYLAAEHKRIHKA